VVLPLSLPRAGSGRLLLITNDPARTFTLNMRAEYTPNLSGTFQFNVNQGYANSIATGYKFEVPLLLVDAFNVDMKKSGPMQFTPAGLSAT
jgi:hypothetical protein